MQKVNSSLKFLGGDNTYRSLDSHLAYLERCACEWEKQFVEGWLGQEAHERRVAQLKEQAERVRAQARDLKKRFSPSEAPTRGRP